MKLLYIGLQRYRDHNASQSGDGICSLLKGESGILPQRIFRKILGIGKDLRHRKVSGNAGEHFVDDVIDRSQITLLDLLHHLLDHQTLPFRTGKISSRSGPDPGIGSSLYSVQKLRTAILHVVDFLACHRAGLIDELIDILDFFFLHIDLHAAQLVDHFRHNAKVHGNVILDVQIQVPVQHIDGLLRTAKAVGRITLLQGSVANIQKGIPVYGNHLDLLGLIVQAGHNDGVRADALLQLTCP